MSFTAKVDISSCIPGMNGLEISALIDLLQKEETNRKTEIKDAYGPDFCNIVSVEKIYGLAKVEAKTLGLENDSECPDNIVTPAMLNGCCAVRGVMGSLRPFIAIKIDILDSKTKEKIDVVVELVFKRYSLKGDGGKGKYMENNYVTALFITSEKGHSFPSFCYSDLYCSGGMSEEEMAAVKDLLDGKTITAPQDNCSLIRMSAQ
jgi:hypothetical protein